MTALQRALYRATSRRTPRSSAICILFRQMTRDRSSFIQPTWRKRTPTAALIDNRQLRRRRPAGQADLTQVGASIDASGISSPIPMSSVGGPRSSHQCSDCPRRRPTPGAPARALSQTAAHLCRPDLSRQTTAQCTLPLRLMTIEIVERPLGVKGFQLPPRCWVVEHAFACFGRCRRLARDFERAAASEVAWLLIAHLRVLTRHLAKIRKCRTLFELDSEDVNVWSP